MIQRRSAVPYLLAAVLLGSVAAGLGSCAANGHSQYMGGDGGSGGSGEGGTDGPTLSSGSTDGPGINPGTGTGDCTSLTRKCSSKCTDFPSAPLIDPMPEDGSPATPPNAATYFSGADGSGAGPCLVEPGNGVLYPYNWVRPRFRVVPASGENLFEITLTSPRQASPYVVYTSSKIWTMPKTVWDAVRADSWGDTVSVKIRGVSTGGGSPTSVTGSFTIAPASAGGSMIYWAAVGDQNGKSWLEGFAPGDESVATTITVPQVKANYYRDQGGNVQDGGAVQCIGCHTAVPDGNSVSFVDFWPWPGSLASVNPMSIGAIPSWITPGGALALSMPWLGIGAYSKTDWMNEKVMITSYGCAPPVTGMNSTYPWSGATCSTQSTTGGGANSSLMWIDLAAATAGPDASSGWALGQEIVADQGKSFGFLARTGDSNGVEFPNWSHGGSTIVYVSTNAGKDGRLASGEADLYTVPYNNRMGGTATPLPGASASGVSEYYPSYSEDDNFIAFDRASQFGTNGMYYNPYSEVYVIPAKGGTATRLMANDPPACIGATSPGVTNSWPKWSPDVEACPDGNTYYWLVFSSSRLNIPFTNNSTNFKSTPDGPTSQLYITGVSVKGGAITTYPALYIWNQATTSASNQGSAQSNHTPVWEVVNISRPPPPK
jgi:hypothetical protein